jgi:hypothetical protein
MARISVPYPGLIALLLSAALTLPAAKKNTVATARGENEDVVITATLHLDPEDVREMIGNDLGGHYIVAEIKFEPKYGKDLVLDRDDFLLRTDKDGDKATPYSGSQIAGQGALIIGTVDKNQGVASPGWTGIHAPVVKGGGASKPKDGEPAAKTPPDKSGDTSLQKTLDTKILPEGKTDKPVSGLLYFPMEKQKMKDLALYYGDKEHRVSMRFKP